MSASNNVIEASCLCGAVKFRVNRALLTMGNCHCSMCRHQHGTAFSTYAQAHAGSLILHSGADQIQRYASSDLACREFCARCGAKLFYRLHALPEFVWIAAGAFDDDPGLECSHHIFTAERAAWLEITDNLPQYAGFPPQPDA